MASKTVLVCDDEPHILHVVSTKLRNAGFTVLTAEDGGEALQIARTQAPDLVVTDYQMPELSGLELCTRLRGDSSTAHIPAIMLSARGFDLTPEDLASTNIRGVLAKPFSPREVLAKVHEVLELGAAAHA